MHGPAPAVRPRVVHACFLVWSMVMVMVAFFGSVSLLVVREYPTLGLVRPLCRWPRGSDTHGVPALGSGTRLI